MPELGNEGVQDDTPAGPVLLVPQVLAVQLLPELAATGEQEATPVGPVVSVVQFVLV